MSKRKSTESRKRILLIEDNPADVRSVQDLLEESGVSCDLVVVPTSEAAFELLSSGGSSEASTARPDLIMLSLGLASANSPELFSRLKSDPALKSIPVVALTSSRAEQDVHKGWGRRADGYIAKPVSLDKLMRVWNVEGGMWNAE